MTACPVERGRFGSGRSWRPSKGIATTKRPRLLDSAQFIRTLWRFPHRRGCRGMKKPLVGRKRFPCHYALSAVRYDQHESPDHEQHDEDERRPMAGMRRRGGRAFCGLADHETTKQAAPHARASRS
jgi:hypothetical protein